MKRDEIIKIIKNELEALSGKEIDDLDKDIFFKSQFLDSLNLLNLIVFLEQKFKIKIDPFFIDRESVSSINKIVTFIENALEKK